MASLAIWGIGLIVYVRKEYRDSEAVCTFTAVCISGPHTLPLSQVNDIAVHHKATGFMGVTPNKVRLIMCMLFPLM